MANLNWGTGEQCQYILVIKKLGTSLKVISGVREQKQMFKGNKDPPGRASLLFCKICLTATTVRPMKLSR